MGNERKILSKKLTFEIPAEYPYYEHLGYIWGDLIKTKELLPTDRIYKLYTEDRENDGMGFTETTKYTVPLITVIRDVPETDEEYFTRMSTKEADDARIREEEFLEFLRLKAKFEPSKPKEIVLASSTLGND